MLLLAAACAQPPAPAPAYAEARRRHAELLATHPRDAASRPEMDEVLALLAQVPPACADGAAAAELRGRIEAERKALAEEAEHRAVAVQKATEAAPLSPGSAAALAPPAPPAPLRLAIGAKLEELKELGADCFERKGDVEIVEGEKKRAGEAWGLKEAPECAERFPADRGQWLLFAEGGYVSTRPSADATTHVEKKTEVRTVEQVERIEVAPLPGGGYGRKTKDGKVEPLPAGAKLQLDPAPKEAKK
jgi:hypothetical protein